MIVSWTIADLIVFCVYCVVTLISIFTGMAIVAKTSKRDLGYWLLTVGVVLGCCVGLVNILLSFFVNL